MKARILTVFAVLAMLFSAFGVGTASAGAYETEFTTSVTYMNVGDATTTVLDLYFFADEADTNPTMSSLTPLAANGAGSLFIGNLGTDVVADGFQGSAYMQSDQPMLVTLVQIPQLSDTVKNRALSNGFSAGAPTALVATVLKEKYNTNTIFSVQNADSETNTVTITLYDTAAVAQYTVDVDIEPGAAYYVDAFMTAGIPTGFNGSAVITAERADASDGSIVANAMKLEYGSYVGLKAFEGVAAGATTVYMPSALCKYYGTDTAYAVQNTSLTTTTHVTATYTDHLGNTYVQETDIAAGAKASFGACATTYGEAMPNGEYGSAVLVSDTTPIIAIGKAYGAGLSTAFVGISTGYEQVALPYVRYATDANYAAANGQRTFITIQNVGGAEIAANTITVQYVNKDGTIAGTHTIDVALAVGAKATSNASKAGLLTFGIDGGYGGAAIITGPAGSELAVVARVSSVFGTGFVSEDYNGQPVP